MQHWWKTVVVPEPRRLPEIYVESTGEFNSNEHSLLKTNQVPTREGLWDIYLSPVRHAEYKPRLPGGSRSAGQGQSDHAGKVQKLWSAWRVGQLSQSDCQITNSNLNPATWKA